MVIPIAKLANMAPPRFIFRSRSLLLALLLRTALGISLLLVGLIWLFMHTLDQVGDRAQDELLRRQMSELMNHITPSKAKGVLVSLPDDTRGMYAERENGALYVVFNPKGKVVARSHPLAPALLEDAMKPQDVPTFYNTKMQDGELQSLFMLTRELPTPNGTFYISVGQYRLVDDLLIRDAGHEAITQLALWALPAGFLMLLAMSASMTATLSPLRRLSGEVKALDPHKLEQRLSYADVPSEVRPLVEAVNGLLTQLERALETQKQLTADTAHQLKTPLAVMRARLELLKKLPGRDDLLADISRMTRLVNQMLQFAQLLQAEPKLEGGDLRDLAQDVVARLAPLADREGVELGVEVPPQPVAVYYDKLLAAEAVQNIIENALKHSATGKGVDVLVRKDGSIDVCDRGEGIPAGEKNLIFTRFWQGEGRTDGSGLGLAIVAEIMRQHGGNVSVRDRDGGGSVFTLAF